MDLKVLHEIQDCVYHPRESEALLEKAETVNTFSAPEGTVSDCHIIFSHLRENVSSHGQHQSFVISKPILQGVLLYFTKGLLKPQHYESLTSTWKY